MNTNSTYLKRYSLPAYLILTPLISNAIALFLPLPTVGIALLMVLVPVIMAILLTALAEGRRSLVLLLKKLFQWRISLTWYATALLMPMGIILTAVVLAFLFGWTPTIQFNVPEPSMLIINSVVVLLAAVFEEFGWRGYALPRLLAHSSPLSSAVLIGIAWGILHIGLSLSAGRPWLPSFLSPLAGSIALTWLFVHTRGSLAMAILYHFAINYFPQFFLLPLGLTSAQLVWAETIANLAVAFALILLFGVNLHRGPVEEPVMA
jgi:membrane protease YdiL (CAAX protease family)